MALNRTEQQPALAGPIQEEALDVEEEVDEYDATPEDVSNGGDRRRSLTEDEKIINARFVEEALQAERDISLFPVGSHRYLEELAAL